MREMLQKKKNDFLTSQKIVTQNCQQCISEIIDVKADLISEIDRRATNLVFEITKQKKKTDASVSRKIADINEKLALVSDIEEITNTKTIFEVKQEKLESVKYAKNKIQSRFSPTTNYTVFIYKKCGEMFKLLSPLCGKLMQENKQIQFEMQQNLASQNIEDGKDNAIKLEERCSLLQENRAANVPVETTSTFNGTDTINGSEADDKTTESPLFEDISTEEDDASIEKATENTLEPQNAYGEMLRKVNGLTAQVYPLKVQAGRVESFPSVITSTPHPPTDITSVYQFENKEAKNMQPTMDAATGVPSANLTSIQPTETSVESNKPAENTLILTQRASKAIRNIQSKVNPVINQPAVSTTDNIGNNQPSVSTVMINQPAVTAVANHESVEKTSDVTQLAINITETFQPTANTIIDNKSVGNISVVNGTVVNTTETNQPSVNAAVSNQPAVSTFWNTPPAGSAAVDNQVSNNTVFYRQMLNSETLCSIPSYPQTTNTVAPKQSAEYMGVCGRSMEGTFVLGYPTSLCGYGEVNAPVGYGSSTMRSTVAQASSVGLLNSVVQPVNTYGFQAMGFGQSPLNTTSQRQPATFHLSDENSLAHSNVHDVRSTGSWNTTAEHRLTEPRKSRFGRRASFGGDAESVPKRPRLETLEDSLANYQGEAIVLSGFLNLFHGLSVHFFLPPANEVMFLLMFVRPLRGVCTRGEWADPPPPGIFS